MSFLSSQARVVYEWLSSFTTLGEKKKKYLE